MRITIEAAKVDVKSGVSKRTGKPYTIRTQECIAESKRYRMPARLTLADEQAAHEPGVYELGTADETLKVNAYGDFEVVRVLQLHRVNDAPKKA